MTESISKRIQSIDILRGLVMVIMALDHVRDYFHINAFTGNYPENMESTNLFLFGTRFVTHFCAPVFVFLAGTSAFLYGQNKTKAELSKFLITRGIWLIAVEIIINNLLWWFDPTYGFINLQVIWAIGICMIVLGILINLPFRLLLILSLVIIFGHNLLDTIQLEGSDPVSLFWYFLHQMNGFEYLPNRYIWFSYPVLPWIGLMVLGYFFGRYYAKGANVTKRRKHLIAIGLSCIVLFFIMRSFNLYGDALHWESYETLEKTIISFFNVSKYPPSLLFILITMGPALLFLCFIENIQNWLTKKLVVFGRVPFFYYVLHILVIHVAAILGLLITGKDWKLMILDNETMNTGALQGYGYSLFTVYLVWIGIVLILYPICKTYMTYKKVNRDKWWLSYL